MEVIAVGLALFTRVPVDGQYVRDLLPAMVLLGFGIGVAFPALLNLAMSGATKQDAGLASGLVNTTAQVGGALGLAVLATLSASRSDDLVAGGEGTASALTSGYHLAFLIGAVLVVAAIVIGIGVLQSEETAEERAEAEADASRREPAYSEAS
jgi:MFS family permease